MKVANRIIIWLLLILLWLFIRSYIVQGLL